MEKKNYRKSKTTKTVTTRLPNTLFNKVIEECEKNNLGRSQFIKNCVSFYFNPNNHKPKVVEIEKVVEKVVKEEYPEPKGWFARAYFKFLRSKISEKDARIKELESEVHDLKVDIDILSFRKAKPTQ